MCKFVSWIEKKELVHGRRKIYFLTSEQIFNTDKGKQLQEWCHSVDDLVGHGAIRHFYGLESDEGENKECVDFSTPDNFPTAIVKAIKDGEWRVESTPIKLLTAPAWKQYKDITAPALKQYEDIQAPAWKQYEDIQAPAWKQYKDIQATAWKQYKDIQAPAFWDLFAIKENRTEAWR